MPLGLHGYTHWVGRSEKLRRSLVPPAASSTKPWRIPSLAVLQPQPVSSSPVASRKQMFSNMVRRLLLEPKHGANRARTKTNSKNFSSETGWSLTFAVVGDFRVV